MYFDLSVLTDAASFQIPLTFRPGHRYRVTVRGLKRTSIDETPDATAAGETTTTTFGVMFKGSTDFRAVSESQY